MGEFNLRQIEVFRAIMLAGSLSGAAKLLFISEPAISRMIAHTEQRIGFPLFLRVKGRLVPTPEARLLYREATLIYQGMQRVNATIEDLRQHRTGALHIASSPNFGISLLPQTINRFSEQHPELDITFYTMLPDILCQAILTHQVDLGVASMIAAPPAGLCCEPLIESRFVAAFSNTHPFCARTMLTPKDLEGEMLIGYGDIPFGHRVREFFKTHGITLNAKINVQQVHVACALAATGTGIALVDEITAQHFSHTALRFIPLSPSLSIPINLLYCEHQPLSRISQAFIETLTETLRG